jgi:hypothetical protein
MFDSDTHNRGDSPTVASTADFKNGLVLVIDGQLWTITDFQHVKPGKGPAFVRTKLKNVLSGKVVDKTYNAGVKVDTATVDSCWRACRCRWRSTTGRRYTSNCR